MSRQLETLKRQEQRFRECNSKHSQDVIVEVLRELKKNGNCSKNQGVYAEYLF